MSLAPVSMTKQTRKRVFVGLAAVSLFFLLLVVLAAWWIVTRRGLLINQVILTAVSSVALLFLLLLGLGLTALVWSLWRSKTIPSLQNIMYNATNVLFPLAIQMGKWLGLNEEHIKNSYIQVSNQLVKAKIKDHPVNKIMILAPHCLQWAYCPYKITINSNNCKRCGKCQVKDLIELSEQYDLDLHIVTGGTAARKAVKECRPKAIVAIACERDLTSGIQDVSELPVLGVINLRPEGPCFNTRVDMGKVEEAIKYLQRGG